MVAGPDSCPDPPPKSDAIQVDSLRFSGDGWLGLGTDRAHSPCPCRCPLFRWLTRKRSAHSPAWMKKITDATPGRAAVIAAVLVVVNPKVLFICAAAGLAIGSAGLGTAGAWISVAFYVLVAASSVAIPVLAYAVAGERLDGPLARLKNWMERHNAALVAAILVIIGLLVLYKGIHGL
jgi:hypothetical protein